MNGSSLQVYVCFWGFWGEVNSGKTSRIFHITNFRGVGTRTLILYTHMIHLNWGSYRLHPQEASTLSVSYSLS